MLDRPLRFIDSLFEPISGGYRSVPGSAITLYGTGYALSARYFLGIDKTMPPKTSEFVLGCQDRETGYFIGPELREWSPPAGAKHDREHLLLHLACATLPVCQEFGLNPRYPLRFAHRFCDLAYLEEWFSRRDPHDYWLEGNNFLFVGQLLVYLRDVERFPGAQGALDFWFRWLDDHVDPETGLWGTNIGCSAFAAMCGGYHQLLVYYYEDHPLTSPERLVDTVLSLQHRDGGFSPSGGGGACEDVDAVDILVNVYKLHDYRRPEIRRALKRCLRLILSTQGDDGGFPYKLAAPQSHMGIADTVAGENISTMFATWFRIHTIALIEQILQPSPKLRFNSALSMGWHRGSHRAPPIGISERAQDMSLTLNERIRQSYKLNQLRKRANSLLGR